MKKFLILSVLLIIVGCNEEQITSKNTVPKLTVCHVLNILDSGDVVIDVGGNVIKPEMKFDIYDEKEMPVARIVITQVAPTHSIGVIVNRLDGSKPEISTISRGMLCKPTTEETLMAEKAIYKHQKKALKRQYTLTKLKAKSGVYESLEKAAEDTNDTGSIKAGLITVDKE
jgi:hypothetical protein